MTLNLSMNNNEIYLGISFACQGDAPLLSTPPRVYRSARQVTLWYSVSTPSEPKIYILMYSWWEKIRLS